MTRPGLAPIAGAIAVELAVAMLHHPSGHRAGAGEESGLGQLPHQVRGSLLTHTSVLPTGGMFPQCSACGAGVLAAFRGAGFEFVERVCKEPEVLDEVSGLRELRRAAEEVELEGWSDCEDD